MSNTMLLCTYWCFRKMVSGGASSTNSSLYKLLITVIRQRTTACQCRHSQHVETYSALPNKGYTKVTSVLLFFCNRILCHWATNFKYVCILYTACIKTSKDLIKILSLFIYSYSLFHCEWLLLVLLLLVFIFSYLFFYFFINSLGLLK